MQRGLHCSLGHCSNLGMNAHRKVCKTDVPLDSRNMERSLHKTTCPPVSSTFHQGLLQTLGNVCIGGRGIAIVQLWTCFLFLSRSRLKGGTDRLAESRRESGTTSTMRHAQGSVTHRTTRTHNSCNIFNRCERQHRNTSEKKHERRQKPKKQNQG